MSRASRDADSLISTATIYYHRMAAKCRLNLENYQNILW